MTSPKSYSINYGINKNLVILSRQQKELVMQNLLDVYGRRSPMEFYRFSELYSREFEGLVPEEQLYKIAIARRIVDFVHRGETRCNKRTPYEVHPLNVTDFRVNALGLRWVPEADRADVIVMHLMHDCRESAPELISYNFMKSVFGVRVANGLMILTKTKNYNKKLYYAALMVCIDLEVIIAKLCDNLNNSNTLGLCNEDFQVRQIYETDIYYVPLAEKLIELLPHNLKWVGRKLRRDLMSSVASYKEEFGPDVFPD